MRKSETVGFIGAGALAEALIGGLCAAGLPAERIWVNSRSDGPRMERYRQLGLRPTGDKAELAAVADTMILAVKPKDAAGALAELRDLVRPDHRLVSCMAGISTPYIEGALGGRPRVVRAMPNLGCAVRASATAVSPGRFTDRDDLDAAKDLLAAVGPVFEVDEDRMDAVTAVAGSGPAYVYYLMEAMAEAAADLGLPGPVARAMIAQTVFGAARLALDSERPPSELRQAVSSPGGTTVAGIGVLDAAATRQVMAAAIRRAAERSRELGRQWAPAADPGRP